MKSIILLAILWLSSFATYAQTIENKVYKISLDGNQIAVQSKITGSKELLSSSFSLLYSTKDPQIFKYYWEKPLNYEVPAWKKDSTHESDLFKVQKPVYLQGKISFANDKFMIRSENGTAKISAEIYFTENSEEPLIITKCVPKKTGWYSVAFSGCAETDFNQSEYIWQPLIFQEKRFPEKSFLSTEYMCGLPVVAVGKKEHTLALIADQDEIPFRLPTFENSGFGMLLCNEKGKAKPMVFAPVLGLEGSFKKTGEAFAFKTRILIKPMNNYDLIRYVSTQHFGFKNIRKNNQCSLNETIENFQNYLLSDFSGWNEELRGFDYSTDVKNTVKVVSSLHPLSVGLITGNKQILEKRAYPLMEYVLSREKYLFTTKSDEKGQSASNGMKGPSCEISELASLDRIFQKKNPVFRNLLQSLDGKPRALNLDLVSDGQSFQNSLAVYRSTGNKKNLEKAEKLANEYIERRINTVQTDFKDAAIKGSNGGQFWSDFGPKWIDLLELYDETKNPVYLDAAYKGAQLFCGYIWYQPAIPSGDVIVNPTGIVSQNEFCHRKDSKPMQATKQSVPAWTIAQVGLHPEASNTYMFNPAVFLATFSPFMLKIGYLKNDTFLINTARSAIVGRYCNYPGYDINGEYTNIYQSPSFPLQDLCSLTYNQIYFNHTWPHLSILYSYLLNDLYLKSKGIISFPSQYAQGYAYIQTQVYGDAPGKWLGDSAWLWMPDKLLNMDNEQINYVSALGNGNTYLAFTNQSPQAQRFGFRINTSILNLDTDKKYVIDKFDGNVQIGTEILIPGQTVYLTVAGHGMTSIRIKNTGQTSQSETWIKKQRSTPIADSSFTFFNTGFGKISSVMINTFDQSSRIYTWLEADQTSVKQVDFEYIDNQDYTVKTEDTAFPFEHTVKYTGPPAKRSMKLYVTDVKGKKQTYEFSFR